MTPEDFKQLLDMHDWSYGWSDDYSVWTKGDTMHRRIYSILQEQPELRAVYDNFVKENVK